VGGVGLFGRGPYSRNNINEPRLMLIRDSEIFYKAEKKEKNK